ncbi:MAG: hypothetical protein ACREI8_11890 [Myxococcota bacterium]
MNAALGVFLLATPGFAQEARERWLSQEQNTYVFNPTNDSVLFGGVPNAGRLDPVESRRLYERDVATGQERLVYEAPSGLMTRYLPSPDGTRIAVLVHADGHYYFRVLAASGRVLSEVADVQDIAWERSGKYLAVTRGVWDNRDVFRSHGTWLLEPDSESLKKVFSGGWYVAWAQFDGALYVLDRVEWNSLGDRVIRIDPGTWNVEETAFKGIYFSPSGRYYVRPLVDAGAPADIFETATNRSLRDEWPELGRLFMHFVGWAPGEDVAVCVSRFDEVTSEKRPERTLLITPAARELTDAGERGFIGSQGDKLVMHRRGTSEKKTVAELKAEAHPRR